MILMNVEATEMTIIIIIIVADVRMLLASKKNHE